MDPILIPIAFFVAVSVIAYVVVQARSRTEANRLDLHSKLIERMGSAREFGEFLSTEAGERFLKSLAPPATSPSSPQMRMILGVRTGIIVTTIGVALFIGMSQNAFPTESEDLAILATLSTAAGVGFLISSFVSYRLARRLGLVEQNPSSGGGTDTVAR